MPRKRSSRDYALLTLRGMCMGAADIVPGVSGGTMAFILGIYEELIDAIRAFGQKAFWKAVFCFRWKQALKITNGKFLCAVALGMLITALSVARVLERLLEEQPILIWSFFFGLILASMHIVFRRITQWKALQLFVFLIGTIAIYTFAGLVPAETPHTPLLLMLSGILAGSAGILPGISGAFVLLLLGKYAFVLHALNTGDMMTIIYVGSGAVVGIIALSQGISWLLHHHHDTTAAFLAGLMFGSLRKIWPWKASGIESGNILPMHLTEDVWLGIFLMLAGATLVLALEWWAIHQVQSDTERDTV